MLKGYNTQGYNFCRLDNVRISLLLVEVLEFKPVKIIVWLIWP